MKRLLPFVTCFFDLPLKNVLQLLGVSHHTLDPIRRSMGMKKWPFVDIVRGQYCEREEIVAMRAQMMPAADTEMQRLLCRAAAKAEEFWNTSTKRIERCRKRKRRSSTQAAETEPVDAAAENDSPAQEGSAVEYPSLWDDEGDEDASSFWDDIRDLFGLGDREAVTTEPWSEHGLLGQ